MRPGLRFPAPPGDTVVWGQAARIENETLVPVALTRIEPEAMFDHELRRLVTYSDFGGMHLARCSGERVSLAFDAGDTDDDSTSSPLTRFPADDVEASMDPSAPEPESELKSVHALKEEVTKRLATSDPLLAFPPGRSDVAMEELALVCEDIQFSSAFLEP